MRLRTRLIISFGALLVLALGASSAVNVIQIQRSVVESSVRNAQGLVEILEAGDRFVSRLPESAEEMIGSQMLVQALLAAHLVDVAENKAKMSPAEITARLKDVVARTVADEFWITDKKGHAYLHTVDGVDFTFPKNPTPQDQAYHFRKLLDQKDGKFVQRTMRREIDDNLFKYAGVSGVDHPRIVQIGHKADSLIKLTEGMSRAALLKSVVGKAGILRLWVVDAEGRALLDVRRGQPTRRGGRIEDPALLAEIGKAFTARAPASCLRGGCLYVALPFASDRKRAALLVSFDATRVGETIRRAVNCSALTALVVLLFGVVVLTRLSRSVADPLTGVTAAAHSIAEGDLQSAEKSLSALSALMGVDPRAGAAESASETRRLFAVVTSMTRSLDSLVRHVQESGTLVTSSGAEIVTSARELEATSTEQAAATNEVAATAREINATARGLADTMGEVAAATGEAASLATTGQSELSRLGATVGRFSDSTRAVSGRLSDIHEKTANISLVVTAINKVAEQTNVLSLNASIEAEKAGEYGQGFSVVAREIRRLSDQTAVALLAIEDTIREVQGAVSAGVMEMDKFSDEMRRGVKEAAAVSGRLAGVIEQVQELSPRIESVNEGMQAQSESAGQIMESMTQLGDAAQQTARSLRELNAVAGRLDDASRGLDAEVSRFRVGGL